MRRWLVIALVVILVIMAPHDVATVLSRFATALVTLFSSFNLH